MQLTVDPDAIAAQRAARSSSEATPVQEQPNPPAPTPADDLSQPAKKKRGRPSAADVAARTAAAEPSDDAALAPDGAAKSHRRGRKPTPSPAQPSPLSESLAASSNVDEANVQVQEPSRDVPLSPAATHVPAAAPMAESAPVDHTDENEDVYIRKACPGKTYPHLIRVARGVVPPQGEDMWQLIEEEELDGKETLQCSVCSRTFLLSRGNAEVLDNNMDMCNAVPATRRLELPSQEKDPLFEEQPLHGS